MPNRCIGWNAASAALAIAAWLNGVPAGAREPGVHDYAQVPGFALASLSPDGAALGFVEQSSGRQSVILRLLGNGAERRTLEVQPARERIRWCDWAGSAYLLCGTVSAARAPDRIYERTRLYVIDSARGDVRELNARLEDPVRDHVIDFSAGGRAGRVLLQYDSSGLGYPEVAELNVATGGLRRIVRSHPPVRRWISDGRGNVRLGVGIDQATASLHVRRGQDDAWTVLLRQALTDADAVGPIALGVSNDLYVLKHHQGRAALFRMDLGDDKPVATLLFADAVYDVAGPVALDPRTGVLLSVQYVGERRQVHFFDDAEAQTAAWLDEQLPGAVNLIVDRSEDARKLLVRSASDVNPPSLYLLDAAERALTLVGHQYPQLESVDLPAMLPTSYRARDGQTIPAYLTSPRGEAARGLPVVVLPHGGPETRNLQQFDPLVQFLAAQGYAVLQMNFRGSFGYGAGFAAAGAGQWGGVIHNDITDATRWLVEQGIADPARTCIVGMSFGGYAALLGAARESQWYACAASFAGVADLMAFSQYTARLRDAEVWKERLGDDSRALWQMSPMARVHAVETPVLMMHGRLDAVAPISQSRRFARALRKAGKPHRLIERGDCDHDMTVDACRTAFFTELQQFLAAALRDAPVVPASAGHSLSE